MRQPFQLAACKQECRLLSEEHAAALENARKIDFERITEKEEARCALIESQHKHQEELKHVQQEFNTERAVIWKKYQELSSDGKHLEHEVETLQLDLATINLTVTKVPLMHVIVYQLRAESNRT